MTTMTERTRTRPLLDTRGASVAADTHVCEKGEMGVLRVPDETRKGSNKAEGGLGESNPEFISLAVFVQSSSLGLRFHTGVRLRITYSVRWCGSRSRFYPTCVLAYVFALHHTYPGV